MKITKRILKYSTTTQPLNSFYDSLNNLKSSQAQTSLDNSSGFNGGKTLSFNSNSNYMFLGLQDYNFKY